MSASIHSLLSAKAVRERAHMILARGLDGGLAHFAVHLDELPAAAAYVADTIQRNYPTLQVPPHARWRHFVVAGEDRWQTLAGNLEVSPNERARIRFDLAITSVLLDAGAGPDWRWRDPATGTMLARSEGLAIASLDAFRQGLFSSNANEPLRADAAGLRAVTPNGLCRVFQVAPDNPLLGLEGRVLLLQRLGDAVAADPRTFGAAGRLGALADRFVAMAGPGPGPVTADDVLNGVLRSFGTIWPGRIKLDGT